ncbi:MAG: IgGFc-binding protein, partial [Dysgonamonadaceae bacterium]|nr:IgGFc-binding protein [Dysgonamonadaceae bacterium]
MKQKLLSKLFPLLLTFVAAGNLFAQTTTTRGKEFFVSWGNNLKDRAARLEIKIAAFEASTITLHFMDQSTPISDIVVEMQKGDVYSHTLTPAEQTAVYLLYSTTPTFSPKSLHIESTGLISAYALNQANATTDATNLLPVSNWGRDYYHISYSTAGVKNQYNGPQVDGYALIAAQDETEIYQAGNLTPIAKLNRGEVYYACFPLTDVTGTHITSNKPIAYYVTNTGVYLPQNKSSADCLFQSLPPVNQWGTRFLVPCTKQGTGRVRVLASQNGTNITQSGATGPILLDGAFSTGSKSTLYNLQAGEFVELEMGATGCYISANKPVGVCAYMVGQDYVTAISSNKGDLSITWVAPIEQNMREILIAPFFPTGTTNLQEHYALIVTPTAYKSETTVAIGGVAPSSLNSVTWTDNMACGYSFCSYQMTEKNTAYLFDNPKGLTVLGYGIGTYESYYYMSGSASCDLTMPYYINDIFYEELNNSAYCESRQFQMRVERELSTAPGHAIWTLNSIPIDAHQDDLEWDTVLPYGKHSLELLVINKEGEAETYGVNFTAAPSSVTWMPENNTGTDADKQNWNDVNNWTPSVLPASCTDVHIPGDKSHYPVLTALDLIPPECGNIYFEHGSEILRTDLLSYSKAHVDLKVRSNRW